MASKYFSYFYILQNLLLIAYIQFYFKELDETNTFTEDNEADRIAILAIYMPIIRREVIGYVEMWNTHRIRKQRDRPNSISGKPIMNYFWPQGDVQNWGTPIDPEIVEELKADIDHFGMIPGWIFYMYAIH
jgi:hypothetical protein